MVQKPSKTTDAPENMRPDTLILFHKPITIIMTEQELVKSCLHNICQSNGFDTPAAMVQRDFELISSAIENKTGILISVSTIKRLLHGEFGRMPQTATLNAIAGYLGFKNWQEYKNATIQKNSPAPPPENKAATKKTPTHRPWLNWKWPGVAVLVTAIVIFFIRFVTMPSLPSPQYEKALFAAGKTTENAIPNTVIFHYNIDSVNADSFFIQQSWDRRRRVRIYKHAYTLTDIYYEPGYHVAKLIANDSVIKTVGVSIPTDRWFLYAKDKDGKSIPQYITKTSFIKNGRLSPGKADLDSSQVNTNEEKTFICCYFPPKRPVSSENFVLTTRLRVKAVRNNQCPYLMCEVFCQRYFMFFKSMPKGCASESSAEFGENYLSGKNADLSSLCYDVSQWMDITFTVKNKQATICFNNTPVFTAAYHHPTGLITGLGFISNGLCEVDAATLKGLDGTVFYEDDFK